MKKQIEEYDDYEDDVPDKKKEKPWRRKVDQNIINHSDYDEYKDEVRLFRKLNKVH